MKFNLPTPQPLPDIDTSLRIGNVYPAQGGKKTKYWMVVAIHDGAVHMLGLNKDDEITKTASYGVHVFGGSSWAFARSESLLGRCHNIENLDLSVEWIREQA